MLPAGETVGAAPAYDGNQNHIGGVAVSAGPRIRIDDDRIAAFCRNWQIAELSLFGSVLRDDFSADSDVDVLVTFSGGGRWGLMDLARMEEELAELFGRPVDLVERLSVERSENYIRRREVLSSLEAVYVAR